mmetsp:Transcript_26204/g.34849  ORF Transcript_26204/g.34849 Transcript_26204/m.34849 type:complete len:1547 (-) Transcript_26204:183-4823(-)
MSQATQILSVGGKQPVPERSTGRDSTSLSNSVTLTVSPLSPKTVTPNRLAGGPPPGKASPASVSFRTPDMHQTERTMVNGNGGVVVSSTISLSKMKSRTNDSSAVSSLNAEMDRAREEFVSHEMVGQRVRGGGPTTPVAALKTMDNKHLTGEDGSGSLKVSSVTPQAYQESALSNNIEHGSINKTPEIARGTGTASIARTVLPRKTRLAASPPTLPSSEQRSLPSPSTPAMRGFVEEMMREEAVEVLFDEKCHHEHDTILKEENDFVGSVFGESGLTVSKRKFFPEDTGANIDKGNLLVKDEEEGEKEMGENEVSLSVADAVSRAVASSPTQSMHTSSKRGVVSRRGGRCGAGSPVRYGSPSIVSGVIGGAPPSPLRSSSSKKKPTPGSGGQGLTERCDDSRPSPIGTTRMAAQIQPRHRPPPPIGLQPRITSVGLSTSCDNTEPSLCSTSSGGAQSTSSPSSQIGERTNLQQRPLDTVLGRKRGRNAVGATVLSLPTQKNNDSSTRARSPEGHNEHRQGPSTAVQVKSSSSMKSEQVVKINHVGEKPRLVGNGQINGVSGGNHKYKPYSITCDASLEAETSPLLSSHHADAAAPTADELKRKEKKSVVPESSNPDQLNDARSPSPDRIETVREVAGGANRNVTFSPPPPSPSLSLFEKHKKTPNRSPLSGQLFHNMPFHDAVLNSPCGIFLSPYSPYGGLGAFDRHGVSQGASTHMAKSDADYVPSSSAGDQIGVNSESADTNTSSNEGKETSTGEAAPPNLSPRSSPRLRDRGGGVTPTNFANDFVFSWLHSPTGQGLFSPGGLSSMANTPRGIYGFASFGSGRPRTPRTPTVASSMFFSDMASFPRDTEFLSPKPPASMSGGVEVGVGGSTEDDGDSGGAHQPMICISPLAATKRAVGNASSTKLKPIRKGPNTPINFRTVFESPHVSSSHGVDAGSGSTKDTNPCSLPLLGDEVPPITSKSLIQRDDPILTERDVMEDEDLSVLLDLASTSTPKGSCNDRGPGRASVSVAPLSASAPQQRKGGEGTSVSVFQSPRSQKERYRSYGDPENPPSSLQIPIMSGRSGRSSPPKQLPRKTAFQSDGQEFGEFNPPNISIRPTPPASHERCSSGLKSTRSTPPSAKKSAGIKKPQLKKGGSFSKGKTAGKVSKTPTKQTMLNGQNKSTTTEIKNVGSKQHDSYQPHAHPMNSNPPPSGVTPQPIQRSGASIGAPPSHPVPRSSSNTYTSSGSNRQESNHYGMPRPASPQRQRQGSSTDITAGDVGAYGGAGGPHRPPPPGMPPAAPHPSHGHYQHQHRHPPPHIPPHHHMPQHPSQHPPHHYHMHSGPASHLPPYPMPHHPPHHPMALYGHHSTAEPQQTKGVSAKGSNQKKSSKAKSPKTGTKRLSELDCKGSVPTGVKKAKKSGKTGKKPKTAAATAAAAAAAHNPVDRQKAAAAIAAVNAASGGKNDKAAALAAAILRGVTMRPSGKWQAQLYYAGKSRYIGVFDTREKAALAYEIAREVLKSDNKSPADQSAQSLKATETAVNAARKAAFEGVNEKDPRLSST